ncbi:hypothetical protein EG68_03961 [Paragonimus skrjabini miyazakii]|uniref:Uncharacterized protein n=1 Tax=Paragonimus skrjabini miyazakii TaxID=59628 RepID=A0A8S9YVQ8_9TREM|nr:hypothetical protein EG68_03961 [Paragonimus skrjabini miyazakii]
MGETLRSQLNCLRDANSTQSTHAMFNPHLLSLGHFLNWNSKSKLFNELLFFARRDQTTLYGMDSIDYGTKPKKCTVTAS